MSFFFLWVREFFVLHRMVGRTQRGVLTPGYFEPCNFPSVALIVNKSLKCSTWMQSQKRQNDLCFQGKPFNVTVIQVYAPTSNAEEADVERFYEYLQNLLVLTPKKYVRFIIGYCNAKVGSQEIPGITGKFGFGVQNEVGQRLTEFCQENTLVIANVF